MLQDAPDISSVFDEVIDDLISASTELATGNPMKGLGEIVKLVSVLLMSRLVNISSLLF